MKTIKILLLALLIVSCSKDEVSQDDVCSCEQTTYEKEYYIIFINGQPQGRSRFIELNSEPVICQDEKDKDPLGYDNLFIDVKCE